MKYCTLIMNPQFQHQYSGRTSQVKENLFAGSGSCLKSIWTPYINSIYKICPAFGLDRCIKQLIRTLLPILAPFPSHMWPHVAWEWATQVQTLDFL